MVTGTALLLIDLQNDYLERPLIDPHPAELVAKVATLLRASRRAGVPVFHCITSVRPDGADAMPHRRRSGQLNCIAGTRGAKAPTTLEPAPGEHVVPKTFFSAFDNPDLDRLLAENGIIQVVLAGVYTHACIRATALDAYARRLEVVVAEDGIASDDAVHAQISIDYLASRAARFLPVKTIVADLARRPSRPRSPPASVWEHRNPGNWDEIIDAFPLDGREAIGDAARRAKNVLPEWSAQSSSDRRECLTEWMRLLVRHKSEFISLLVRDVGKPLADAGAEFEFAHALLRNALIPPTKECPDALSFEVTSRPRGVVALITPFNNPLAIPVGKLAPALAYGNTVVWKPALPGTGIATFLLRLLGEAGMGTAVQQLRGDAETGMGLLRQPEVCAVSFTGSVAAGYRVASACAMGRKLLQAELGGNNAVLVMEDAELPQVIECLAPAMFSFAGQRCTAPRRIIVHRGVRERFEQMLLEAIAQLRMGAPNSAATQVGPLISRVAQDRMQSLVTSAVASGAHVLCGGLAPAALNSGCYFAPTVIGDPGFLTEVVQEESFGPVCTLHTADNLEDALQLCNGVPQGLVATLFSNNPAAQSTFRRDAQAGLLALNVLPLPVDPAAPFGGWKNSGIGLPEHGRWDQDFYSKPQAIYAPSAHGRR